jgi:hypothetical protein
LWEKRSSNGEIVSQLFFVIPQLQMTLIKLSVMSPDLIFN